jgi:hypothetical protein
VQPVLLPKCHCIGEQVAIDDVLCLHAFLLREVCDLPFGFRWPTTIGFFNFAASTKAALGKSHQHFSSVLQALQSQLEPWFMAVSADSTCFLISGQHFLSMYDKHFPEITALTTDLESGGVFPSAQYGP